MRTVGHARKPYIRIVKWRGAPRVGPTGGRAVPYSWPLPRGRIADPIGLGLTSTLDRVS